MGRGSWQLTRPPRVARVARVTRRPKTAHANATRAQHHLRPALHFGPTEIPKIIAPRGARQRQTRHTRLWISPIPYGTPGSGKLAFPADTMLEGERWQYAHNTFHYSVRST